MSGVVPPTAREPRAGGMWARAAPLGWSIALTVLVLAPALIPGYVLSYDMVFTPEQSLLPWMFGADSGLPRAVPQDPFVGLVAGPVAGQILQKVALVAALILAGTGANAVLRQSVLPVRLAAITLAIWNPFVAERLVIGHWALLLAYGVAPWVLLRVVQMRRGDPGAWIRVVAVSAIGCLVPSGAILMIVLVVPALAFRSLAKARERILVGSALLLFSSTWLVAAVLNPANGRLDTASVPAFALSGENWAGLLGAAVTGGGIWNADVVPASRALPWVPLVGLGLLTLALLGRHRLGRTLDRVVAMWLFALAAVGLVVALLLSWSLTQSVLASLLTWIPGGGLLRDGQKLLLPLVLLVALAAPLGLLTLLENAKSARRVRNAALAVLAILPIAVVPDLAMGALGKLEAVHYPQSWSDLRDRVVADSSVNAAGDAISLPWSAFRRYEWNGNRTVLDPMPRYLPITVLTDDRLPVSAQGAVEVSMGDNPRSAAIAAALTSGSRNLDESLPELGIRYVIEQTDQPMQLPSHRLAGLELVAEYPGLRLWSVTEAPSSTRSFADYSLLVGVNTCALLVLLAAWTALIAARIRTRLVN